MTWTLLVTERGSVDCVVRDNCHRKWLEWWRASHVQIQEESILDYMVSLCSVTNYPRTQWYKTTLYLLPILQFWQSSVTTAHLCSMLHQLRWSNWGWRGCFQYGSPRCPSKLGARHCARYFRIHLPPSSFPAVEWWRIGGFQCQAE